VGIPLVGTLVEAGLKVLDKVIPDPQAKIQAQYELLKLQQAGEFKGLEADLQLALGQLEVNKIEAAAPDMFRGGWRPALGWVCVTAFAVQMVAAPLLPWVVGLTGRTVAPIPSLDLTEALTLLGGMLGFGGMRTLERLKGRA
jgi:hypothetical protein